MSKWNFIGVIKSQAHNSCLAALSVKLKRRPGREGDKQQIKLKDLPLLHYSDDRRYTLFTLCFSDAPHPPHPSTTYVHTKTDICNKP